ncbi:hypothetical protein ACIBL6_47620 [Streptomyces sp. NPDC050400]|uniref:hypothetical protein n=1 Tax=Streptomyces sp. NPDC050400 TaxID=3365610 RepID=UPI0037A1920D
MKLFTRRASIPDAAVWTPPGTTVVQRYRNALGHKEGAVVLVYTAGERRCSYFATACLGCTYRAASTARASRLTEAEAADLANTHAVGCRAMGHGVPAAPGDFNAAQIVRDRLRILRPRHLPAAPASPHSVLISNFHVDRVALQRDDAFIQQAMTEIARTEPDFVTTELNFSGTGTQFVIQPHPAPKPAPRRRTASRH